MGSIVKGTCFKWVSLLSLLAVTACSGATGTSTKSDAQAGGTSSKDNGKVVQLKFWGAVPPETGPQEVVDNWNKANPDIQVTYTRFVNDDSGNTKMETALIAGSVDIFMNYTWEALQKRVESRLLEPIDDFLKKDNFKLEEQFGSHPYTVNGKSYYMPTVGGPGGSILYNQDMLEQAGIQIPENWTWDDYMKIAKQLTKGSGDSKVYGSIAPTVSDGWAVPAKSLLNGDYIYKDGTKESNFDHPSFLKSLQIKYQMENIDLSQVPMIDMKASKVDVAAEFAKGKVAMVNNMHQIVRDLKNLEKYPHTFKTGFATYPLLNADQKEVWSGGLREWIAMSPKAANKEAAWKFMKYYATEGIYPMSKSGTGRVVPAWKKANTDQNIINLLGEDRNKLFDVEQFKKVVLNNARHRNLEQIRIEPTLTKIVELMSQESQKALLNEQSLEEAVNNMKKKADAIIKSDK